MECIKTANLEIKQLIIALYKEIDEKNQEILRLRDANRRLEAEAQRLHNRVIIRESI